MTYDNYDRDDYGPTEDEYRETTSSDFSSNSGPSALIVILTIVALFSLGYLLFDVWG